MTETAFSNMKIQSCTAKLLKYPALATVAAMVSSLTSCEQQETPPQTPCTEKQADTQTSDQTEPQSCTVPPETAEQQPEEEPEMLAGDVPYIPEEEEATTETPTIIPQNTVGSVPSPVQEQHN